MGRYTSCIYLKRTSYVYGRCYLTSMNIRIILRIKKEVRYGLKAIDFDDHERRLGTHQCKRQPLSIQAPGKTGTCDGSTSKKGFAKGDCAQHS